MSNFPLDMRLETLKKDISDAGRRAGRILFFTKFSQLGIEQGKETIELIANYLPSYSVLIVHLSSSYGNSSIYPHFAGVLTVVKTEGTHRVSFKFERKEGYWVGFYDTGGAGNAWSGWTNIFGISVKSLKEGDYTSFDDITRGGRYYLPTSVVVSMTNEPIRAPGYLTVIPTFDEQIIQEFITNTSANIGFRRLRGYSGFGNWAAVPVMLEGEGSPEGTYSGTVGSSYYDKTNNLFYRKEYGFGNTGWKQF